jgi:hypothetical protein
LSAYRPGINNGNHPVGIRRHPSIEGNLAAKTAQSKNHPVGIRRHPSIEGNLTAKTAQSKNHTNKKV